ncbi:MAG: hypothetical protein KDC87_14525 [Planctomycetes bacterium]|nr:hypothetical protein [Planctomycetota bacterium]
MPRIRRALTVGACLAGVLAAQEAEVRDLAQVRTALHKLAKAHGKARFLAAEYRQERTSALLRKPLVSTGTLVLRLDPPCLVFTASGANGTKIRLTRDTYEVYRPSRARLERTVLPDPTQAAALFGAFRPVPEVLEARFRITRAVRRTRRVARAEQRLLEVTLVPKDAAEAKLIRQLSITLDETGNRLHAIAYRDPQGDAVRLFLDKLQVRDKVDAAAFDWTVPKGTEVLVHRPPKPQVPKSGASPPKRSASGATGAARKG